MEFLIEKKVHELMLVKYTAYVEANSIDEAIEKAKNDDNDIDWDEDYSEFLNSNTISVTEKTY